jgi:arsenate reductase
MMSLTAELYWLPHCSTCQKAKAFLEEQGVSFTLVHDIKATALSEAQVKRLVDAVGGVDALFSKRAMKFRQWGLNEKELSQDELFAYMVQEYTFIKRPVTLLSNGDAFAGFAPKQMANYFDALKASKA